MCLGTPCLTTGENLEAPLLNIASINTNYRGYFVPCVMAVVESNCSSEAHCREVPLYCINVVRLPISYLSTIIIIFFLSDLIQVWRKKTLVPIFFELDH